MRRLLPLVLPALLAGCIGDIAPENPYDPSAPVTKQARGSLTGVVVSDAEFLPEDLKLVVDGLTLGGTKYVADGVEVVADEPTGGRRFTAKVPPGTYRVRAEVPRFDPVEKGGIPVASDSLEDVGVLALSAGRGLLHGRVLARSPDAPDAAPPLDTRVTLLRLSGPLASPDPTHKEACAEPGLAEAVVVGIKPDGQFDALGLAAGPYIVIAERDGYVPGLSVTATTVEPGKLAEAPTVVLQVASNVVAITADRGENEDPASRATSQLVLRLNLAVPDIYNAMRVSEDPSFADPLKGDTVWGEKNATPTWTLPAGDGERKLYVQFRAPTCRTSPVYEGSMIIDRTPPVAEPAVLSLGRTCSRDRTTRLDVRGADQCGGADCAGLYRMRVAPGASVESAVWKDFDTSAEIEFEGDGDLPVTVQLRDRAGNDSAPVTGTVLVNTLGPQVHTPAILVNGGQSSVRSKFVQLRLDVDGAGWLELANASGLDGRGWLPFPPGGLLSWELADGDDGDRQVFARFRDECGNVTDEVSVLIDLDRSARVRGGVRFSGRNDHSGVVVAALRKDDAGTYVDTGRTTTTGPDGAWAFTGLPPGTYAFTLAAQGYASRRLDAIEVAEGAEVTLSELTLDRARGSIGGVAKLGAATDHSGITVTAGTAGSATTGADGKWTIDAIPVGPYTIVARRDRYLDAQAQALVTVLEGETVDVPELTLTPRPGSISGSARFEGRSDPSGITIALQKKGEDAQFTAVGQAAETGAEGSFAFADLLPGTYRIRASGTGFVSQNSAELKLGPADDLAAPALLLAAARGRIEGTAKLGGSTDHGGISVTNGQTSVSTDATGRFVFEGLAVGDYQLEASKDRYASATTTALLAVKEGETTTSPALTLAPLPGSIRGNVSLEGTDDPSGVAVALQLKATDGEFSTVGSSAQVGSNGRYSFASLAPGTYRLNLSRLGFVKKSSDELRVDPAAEVIVPAIGLSIARGTLTGTATLGGGATDHSGITVTAGDKSTTTDAAGAWTLEGLQTGSYQAKATRDHYVTATAATANVTEGGSTAAPTIVLQAMPGAIRGTISVEARTDPSGVTATLLAKKSDGTFATTGATASTGTNGRFTFTNLAPGTFRVRLSLTGHTTRTTDDLVVEPQGEVIVPDAVVAIARGTVTGTVSLEGQTDFSGVTVTLATGLSGTTNALGEYTITAVPVGTYKAKASKSTTHADKESGNVTVAEGTTATVPALALAALPGKIRGTVRLPSQADHSGVLLTLFLRNVAGAYAPTGTTVTSGTDGSFSFNGLALGTYRVRMTRAGYVKRDLDGVAVGPGADVVVTEILLEVARGHVDGTVRLQGESAHDGILVTAGLGISTLTDRDGKYSFRDLPVATYVVRASKGTAFQSAQVPDAVVVTEGATADAGTLTLQPIPGRVQGIAQLPGRTSHAGISVLIDGFTVGGANATASTTSDADGVFAFSTVVSGTYSVTISANGFRTQRQAGVVVGPGSTVDLGSFVLSPATGKLRGHATLAGASSNEGVRVGIATAGAEIAVTATNALGAWSLPEVATGEYTVTFSAVGYGTKRVTNVVVPADGEAVVADQELARQVGEVSLKNIGESTNAATWVVTGSYPDAQKIRVCEDPAITDPVQFEATCLFEVPTFTNGGTRFDSAAKTFKKTCSNGTAACDGQKHVYVQVQTTASQQSSWFDVPVVLDTKAPKANVVIEPTETTLSGGTVGDGGSLYTRVTTVRVAVRAEDDRSAVGTTGVVSGPVSARLLRSPTDTTPLVVSVGEGLKIIDNVSLGAGADGGRNLYVQITDGAGNVSVSNLATVVCPQPRATTVPTDCDAIFLDTTAPGAAGATAVKLALNPDPTGDFSTGAAFATSPLVRVGINSANASKPEDEAVEAILANDPNFESAVSQSLPAAKTLLSWFLSGEDGPKTVYVKLKDRAGNTSVVLQKSLTLDTVPPDVPVPVAVGTYTNKRRPPLSFGPGLGAASHRLQLSPSASFDTNASGFVDVTLSPGSVSTWTPTADLAEGKWFWRVRATDPAGLTSSYSNVDSFTVDVTVPAAPTLQPLAPAVATDRPEVRWTAVADASLYEIEFDDNASFSNTTRLQATAAETRYTPLALNDRAWFVRVRAVDGAGNKSAWSTTATTVVDTTAPGNPSLTAPASGALLANGSVAFSWSTVSGAASYVVHLGTDSTLSSFDSYPATTTTRTFNLGDGAWTFRVGAVDAAGNASDIVAATKRTFTVDTTAPNTPTLTPLASLVNVRTPAFLWSSESASGATSYVLTVDARTYTVTGTTHTPTDALGDGTHSWSVLAVDAAGNRSVASSPQTFSVDATAPAAPVLEKILPNPGSSTQPTFSWSASAGTASYAVEWDTSASFGSSSRGTATVEGTSTRPSAALADGRWYVRVRATDAAANVSAWSATETIDVDTAAPADGTLGAPTQGQTVTSSAVAFSWSAVAGAASYRLEVATAATFASAQVDTGITGTTRTLSLADGAFFARVISVDAAGNASAGANVRSFSVDTTAPAVPVLTGLASPTSQNRPSITWSSSASSGATTYRVQVDGVVTTVSTNSFTPTAALADGPHTVAVAAVDAAGNASAYSTPATFEVDATAPAAPTLTAVAPDPTASATATAAWGAVADAVTYEVAWDESSSFNIGVVDTKTVAAATSTALGPLAEGTWFWRVRAIDDAGNVGAWSSSDGFTIDLTRPANPVLSTPANDAVLASSTVTLTWAASSGASSYLVDVSDAAAFTTWERTEVTSLQRSVTLPDASRWWRVLAVDAAGNVSDSASAAIRKLTIDTAAPATPVLTSVATPGNVKRPTLAWAAVSGATSYTVTLDGVNSTVSATQLVPSSDLSDGTHTWTAVAKDAAGNTSPAAPAQSFLIDTQAPGKPTVIAYLPDPSSDNTPTVEWDVTASAVSYVVEWDTTASFNSANRAEASTSATTWTIGPLANGTWFWRVKALDAVGNASVSSNADSLDVDSSAPAAPTPVSPSDAATLTAASVTFQWQSISDAASYRLQVGSDATISTTLFDVSGITGTTRTLTLSDGTYYWRVLATDAAGNQTPAASATVRSVVVDANAPSAPTLSAVLTPSRDARPVFTWTSQAGTGATTYNLVLDAATSALSATTFQPSSALGEGTHTVKVQAVDAAGNASAFSPVQTFLVDTVAPTKPSGLSPANSPSQVQASIAFSWTAAADSNPPLTYDLQVARGDDFASLAASASVSGTTSTITLADGSYFWRVRAVDPAGNTGAWAPDNTGRALTIDTVAPVAPELVAVASLVRTSPTLRWTSSASSGATRYDLQVDDDTAFGSPVLDVSSTAVERATSLADGAWSWRVRALDAAGNASAWTSSGPFTVDSVAPGIPGSASPVASFATASLPVSFSWAAATGTPDTYLLEIAYDSAFTAIAQQVTTAVRTVTLVLPDGTYYWRVTARDAAGNAGLPAGKTAFTIDTTPPSRPDILVSPAWVNQAATTFSVGWSDESDSGASTYEYQVAGSNVFGSLIAGATLTATTVTVPKPTTDGTYYWRVRAKDALGNASGWTPVQQLGVDTQLPTQPAFTLPASAALLRAGVVGFSWGASTDSNPVTYTLQVGQENTFSNQVVVNLDTAARVTSQSLSPDTYYWRVRAVDAAGNPSQDWSTSGWVPSNARTFTIDTTAPDTTSFAPFAAVTSNPRPALAWAPVSDARKYTVTIATDDQFTSVAATLVRTGSPPPTSLTGAYSSNLSDNTYYARIVVEDAAGNPSVPSPVLSFRVDTAAPSAPASCSLSPLVRFATATNVTTPTFLWSAVADAASFKLEKQVFGTSFTTAATAENIPPNGAYDVTYTLPPLLALADNGRYRFRVSAVDAAGNVSATRDCLTNAASATEVRVDLTPPGVPGALTITPTTPTSNPDATVAFARMTDTVHGGEMGYLLRAYTEAGALVYEKSVDWTPAPVGTDPRTIAVAKLPAGTYSVRLAAVDAATNLGAFTSGTTHVIDRDAPRPPSPQSPVTTTTTALRTNVRRPTFSWTDESSTGATTYTLRVYASDAGFRRLAVQRTIPNITGTQYQLSAAEELPLSASQYYRWAVTAFDAAGNESGENAPPVGSGLTPWFELDTTPPAAPTSQNLPGIDARVRSSSLAFTFTSPTDTSTRYVNLEVYDQLNVLVWQRQALCGLSGSCIITSTNPGLVNAFGELTTEGSYVWRVRLEDDAGNASSWVSGYSGTDYFANLRKFSIDDTSPNVPSPVAPANGSWVNTCSPTISWTNELASGAASYDYYVQKKSGSNWTNVAGAFPGNTTSISAPLSLGSTCDGTFRFWVVAKDAAGNASQASVVHEFKVDSARPPAPTLLSVDARNRSARLFWDPPTDTAAGTGTPSGIASYKLWCALDTASLALCGSATGDALDGWVLNLANKRNYRFAVSSVDGAGNESVLSGEVGLPVGWKRVSIPVASVYPVRPLGVASRGDNIYVTYMEMDAEWTHETGNLKVAVSNNGGESWTFKTLDSAFAWSRREAPIVFSDSGVVIGSIGSDQDPNGFTDSPPTAWDDRGVVRLFASQDNGTTWTQRTASSSTTYWGRTSTIGLWASGDRVTATYLLGHDTNNYVYATSTPYGGQLTFGTPAAYYTGISAAYDNTTSFRSCSGNYGSINFWKESSTSLTSLTHHYLNDATASSGEYTTATVSTGTGAEVGDYDVACAAYPDAFHAYAVYTYGSSVRFRRKLVPTSSWGTQAAIKSDYDSALAEPARVWAGGGNVYVAYRATGTDANGPYSRLALGESTDDGATFPTANWSDLSSGTSQGHWAVMNGDGGTDLVVAFTDADSASLTLMQPARRSVKVKAFPGVGTSTLTWSSVPSTDVYQIDHDSNGAPWDSKALTSLSSFDVTSLTAGEQHQVRSLDAQGMPGNDGDVWQVAPFTEDSVIGSATGVGGASSSAGGVGYNDTFVVLPPYDWKPATANDGTLYRSTDAGVNFTALTPSPSFSTSAARELVGFDGKLYFFYRLSGSSGLRARVWTDITAGVYPAQLNLDTAVSADQISAASDPAYNRVLVAYSNVATDTIKVGSFENSTSTLTARGSFTIPDPSTFTIESVLVNKLVGPRAVVAWRQKSSTAERVYYSETTNLSSSNTGATWSTPVLLSSATFTTSPCGDFSIGRSARLIGRTNNAYSMLAWASEEDSTCKRAKVLKVYLTGTDHNSTTSGSFAFFEFDKESISQTSLDAMATAEGHFMVYRSEDPDANGRLEMAACFTNCHLAGSWYRKVLRGSGESGDYLAPLITVAQSTSSAPPKIYVTYRGGTTNTDLTVLRGGIYKKVR